MAMMMSSLVLLWTPSAEWFRGFIGKSTAKHTAKRGCRTHPPILPASPRIPRLPTCFTVSQLQQSKGPGRPE